jgi:peptidoglycan hydrolase-like protein with peptidoglycan-binding domain
VVSEPFPTGADAPDAERVRWLQDCLNRVEDLRLPVTGYMDAATRSALRRFQSRSGLRASGIAGPDTEDALRRVCGEQPASEPQQESGLDWMVAPSPPPAIPRFEPRQLLTAAARSATGAGVYILFKEKTPFYVGETNNLRRRMGEHLLCLTHMAVPTANYFATVAPMKAGTTPADQKAAQAERKVVQRELIRRFGRDLTNVQTRELEEELFGAGFFGSDTF